VSGEGDRGVPDVERYEQLRTRVLAGEPDGFRLGRAMLEHHGVAAWTRAWQATAPPPAVAREPTTVTRLPSDARQIVGVLATMALASAAAG
jgi:hypothetical protein